MAPEMVSHKEFDGIRMAINANIEGLRDQLRALQDARNKGEGGDVVRLQDRSQSNWTISTVAAIVFGLLGFLVGSIGIVLAIVDFLLKVRSP